MSGSGRERLERALIRLSRPGSKSAGRGRVAATAPSADTKAPLNAPAAEEAHPVDGVGGGAIPAELLELVDRLDNIADRLADMEQPGRPLPATRAIFSEWVRLRKWEEIPFVEFLTLRRAGRL